MLGNVSAWRNHLHIFARIPADWDKNCSLTDLCTRCASRGELIGGPALPIAIAHEGEDEGLMLRDPLWGPPPQQSGQEHSQAPRSRAWPELRDRDFRFHGFHLSNLDGELLTVAPLFGRRRRSLVTSAAVVLSKCATSFCVASGFYGDAGLIGDRR